MIYNGIDLQQYQWTPDTSALEKYGVEQTRPYVLFVGRITRQKGVTHLVDAIRYLRPGTQIVLCAGAPDTPEIAAELQRKVEAARAFNPGVIWIDKMLSKQEAIQLYSLALCFAAQRCMSRSASSILRPWLAGRRSWPVPRAASRRSWLTG